MSNTSNFLSFKYRLRLGGIHLIWSLAVALLAAALVFGLWYPAPYRTLSGGLHLFSLLVVVDVMLGPLATMVVSKLGKSARAWRTDVALIALVQCAALGYGLWTLHQARPVYMAFELDRFRVVHAVDVPPGWLAKAPAGFQKLPLTGPAWVAVRPPASGMETVETTIDALQGFHLAFRPELWIPYEQSLDRVRQEAKPLSEWIAREPQWRQPLLQALEPHGLTASEVVYLPLLGRTEFWTMLLHANTLKPLAYLPIDPYGE
jgi:hypothetical protein